MDQVYIGTTNYGRHWLSRPAAEAWFRMVRDGCPAAGITDAGRTQAEQETLFRKHFTTNYGASAKFDRRSWAGQVWYRAYRPGTRTPWPSAATPGSRQARHQWGLSLDLNGATKAWVRAHGRDYGWIKDVVSGEDWHMEYQSARDVVLISNPGASVGGALPSPDLTPIKPIEEAFMPALTDDEQRRLLEAADILRLHFMHVKGRVDATHDYARDTTTRTQVIRAQGENITNGVSASLRTLQALAKSQGVKIDEAEIARELAPLLIGSLGSLSDEDVQRIAQAAADVQAERLSGRA